VVFLHHNKEGMCIIEIVIYRQLLEVDQGPSTEQDTKNFFLLMIIVLTYARFPISSLGIMIKCKSGLFVR
jgi:hypothetical protein